MKKINVFLPWNLPEYYPANGFHNLYDFLLEDNDRLDFKVLKIEYFDNKFFLNGLARLNEFDPEFKNYNKSSAISYLLNKIGASGCELEFLHTSPIFASKNKPFIFHLEDFQSIFLHRDISPTFKNDVDLQNIFERKNCLAIISHIPETLQSFRNYFNSPDINSKLHYSKIALSDSFSNSVNRLKTSHKESSETVFLFTSSSSDHVIRGFKVVINLAKKLIESNRKVKFIFKCAKLSKSDFLSLGLSDEQIDFIYNCPSITWYEERLSNDEMNVLYKLSDFLLLPSAQLHSMEILKSMYCEVIPVVTDIIGTDQYVTHLEDGIILKGVKEALFQDKVSLLKANIENYPALENSLTEQLFSNLVKIIDQKGVVEKMRSEARKTVIKNYAFADSADQISSYISVEYGKKIGKDRNKLSRLLKKLIKKYFLSADFGRYKQAAPQKVFEWENIKVFKHHSRYYLLDSAEEATSDIARSSKSYKNILEVYKELRRRLFSN